MVLRLVEGVLPLQSRLDLQRDALGAGTGDPLLGASGLRRRDGPGAEVEGRPGAGFRSNSFCWGSLLGNTRAGHESRLLSALSCVPAKAPGLCVLAVRPRLPWSSVARNAHVLMQRLDLDLIPDIYFSAGPPDSSLHIEYRSSSNEGTMRTGGNHLRTVRPTFGTRRGRCGLADRALYDIGHSPYEK